MTGARPCSRRWPATASTLAWRGWTWPPGASRCWRPRAPQALGGGTGTAAARRTAAQRGCRARGAWSVPARRCAPGRPGTFETETCTRALNRAAGHTRPAGLRPDGRLARRLRGRRAAAIRRAKPRRPRCRISATLNVEQRGDALMLDAATRRNLELDSSLSGNPEATLFALIDRCVTAMGSRQLRRWLNRTLTDQALLRQRYQRHRGTDRSAPLRGAAPAAGRHRRYRAHPGARRACARRGRAIWRSCAAPSRACRELAAAAAGPAADSPLLSALLPARAVTRRCTRC